MTNMKIHDVPMSTVMASLSDQCESHVIHPSRTLTCSRTSGDKGEGKRTDLTIGSIACSRGPMICSL